MTSPRIVLFACVHNAGRSQMGAALFNQHADPAKAIAISAGTQPAAHVHPEVLLTMQELGVDLSNIQPRFLSDELASTAGHLITMGCGEACPYIANVIRDDWQLQYPKGQSVDRVREIRDDIVLRVQQLIAHYDWAV